MKQKLTLTVDRGAVKSARRAARKQGISISSIFERTFAPEMKRKSTFGERWLGKHPPAPKVAAKQSASDPRFERLLKKYVKSHAAARAD